jgi:hypothetical protein
VFIAKLSSFLQDRGARRNLPPRLAVAVFALFRVIWVSVQAGAARQALAHTGATATVHHAAGKILHEHEVSAIYSLLSMNHSGRAF